MPGYSIKQISALTGQTEGYFRHNAYKIKGSVKDSFKWRFPLDGLSEFIISNEKVLLQFKERMRDRVEIPFKYYDSGKLLEDRIDTLLAEKRDKPIEMLTTKDIVSLPMGDFFQYSRQVSELCRTKKLFGVKTNIGYFSSWKIPTESFAIFLVRNLDECTAFVNMKRTWLSYWKEKDTDMYRITHSIQYYLNKIPFIFEETYTAQKISDIFDLPLNEVFSYFFPVSLLGKINAKIPSLTKERSVSWRAVADYLRANPERVQYLYDKWERLSKQGSEKEYDIRHLLMLYEYYISNA